METSETLRWTARYLARWLLAAVVGGAIVVGGVALGGLAELGFYGLTPTALRLADAPAAGLAVIVVGLLVFRFGTAAAFIGVLVSATESQLRATLDTESLKSDILSVLDERLAEMHEELADTKRMVGEVKTSSAGFEFVDE